MDKKEELKLRDLIRKELESRTKIQFDESESSRARQAELGMSEERRRIIEDEIRRFHKDRGDTQEYVNEEGDVEWLTEAEIIEREKQIPVDIEELEVGQRHVRNRVVMISILLFLGVVLVFVAMRDRSGSVQVICNVPDAAVYLNGSVTEFRTNHILRNLPAGYHLISVYKHGYVPDGDESARVQIGAGSNEIIVLKLKPKTSRASLE